MRKFLYAIVIIFSSHVAACAKEDASSPSGGNSSLQHDNLIELAGVVRRGGGVIVRGRVVGDWTSAAPNRLLATGSYLEYGRVQTTVRVEDALGSAAMGDLSVLGSSGVVRWTDAEGRPTGQTVTDSDQIRPWQRLSTDAAGVFFLYPRVSVDAGAWDWFVYWIAPVNEANEVSGEGTRSRSAVSLSSLRL